MVTKLHEGAGFGGILRLNACVVDAKGTVPYLGTPMYFADAKATGLPYVLREVDFFRSLDEPASWIPMIATFDATDSLDIDVGNAFTAFTHIARSLGIPPHLSMGYRDDEDELDIEPLSRMFADLLSRNFAFTREGLHNARDARDCGH